MVGSLDGMMVGKK